MSLFARFLAVGSLAGLAIAARADDKPSPRELHDQAVTAANAGKLDEAVRLAGLAIAAEPENAAHYGLRAAIRDSRREFAASLADHDRVVALQPDEPESYYRRGRARFCAGKVAESVADFDKTAALDPRRKPSLWERGISLYYAGKFDDGAAQFALYQTFDNQDVENATWRYLCMARSEGVEKARAELLPIAGDRRVPMKEIYELYRGKLEPEAVLKAAEAGEVKPEVRNGQLFYAHLYLGLYHEAAGNERLAREHILKAEEHKIGHYMWDVAHVHAERLRKAK